MEPGIRERGRYCLLGTPAFRPCAVPPGSTHMVSPVSELFFRRECSPTGGPLTNVARPSPRTRLVFVCCDSCLIEVSQDTVQVLLFYRDRSLTPRRCGSADKTVPAGGPLQMTAVRCNRTGRSTKECIQLSTTCLFPTQWQRPPVARGVRRQPDKPFTVPRHSSRPSPGTRASRKSGRPAAHGCPPTRSRRAPPRPARPPSAGSRAAA